ncbi:TPA: hypothetical protein QDB15_006703 [Burkholderia vietnamiensis]|uniref:hypothetical protein n=1 Tax=Burkholderia TaxID=32008 RepID=UPI000A80F312|nr:MULTISPECIES: hypothetical protein [Burkholderia]MBR7914099.1 hypothetical protein [Burkholderia vietnamiensis]MBR8003866.1 hypothetical protein [Burkholderia vietnamiensis]MBR8219897.1 hypothetical protein [Burkholderia vietnamiensis]MCA8212146.1 hypothetical protein [Burkholderia vietnamiensis]MCB4342975.1 hypothetical protein [Burkholderia vietnamiensis]
MNQVKVYLHNTSDAEMTMAMASLSKKLQALREDLSEDDRELLSAVAQAAAADIDGLHEPKPDAQFIFLKPMSVIGAPAVCEQVIMLAEKLR